MSELTPRLGLPLLMAAQAQKHVTHNEALVLLDRIAQLTVEDFAATTPPAEPLEGQVWALGPAPSGDWQGQGGRLAAWIDGAWHFTSPAPGWRAAQGSELRLWDGDAWIPPDLPVLDGLPGLGINTSHDATNRLSVAAPATLLTHEGAGHQLKIDKAASAETASLLFQTGFSGRAEMGTAGNDDFAVKVSADGSVWHDGLVVARASGAVSAPGGLDAATLTRAGSPVYARNTILGPVSQSAGVPTGAVIQRGSNANGEFTRFADGTQICTHRIAGGPVDTPSGAIFRSDALEWVFPAAFAVAPCGSASSVGSGEAWAAMGMPGTSAAPQIRIFASAALASAIPVDVIAIGRWF